MARFGYLIPSREKPDDDTGYFEQLTKAVFRAGFSWQVVEGKWPNFQKAFDNFEIEKIAAYGDRDIARLLEDEGIIRNGHKIAATVENAQEFRRIIADHGSFHTYLRSLDDRSYAERCEALAQRFKNLGPTSVFVFLHCVDEEVPDWENRLG